MILAILILILLVLLCGAVFVRELLAVGCGLIFLFIVFLFFFAMCSPDEKEKEYKQLHREYKEHSKNKKPSKIYSEFVKKYEGLTAEQLQQKFIEEAKARRLKQEEAKRKEQGENDPKTPVVPTNRPAISD